MGFFHTLPWDTALFRKLNAGLMRTDLQTTNTVSEQDSYTLSECHAGKEQIRLFLPQQ